MALLYKKASISADRFAIKYSLLTSNEDASAPAADGNPLQILLFSS
jgi:hypothetical protein